MKKIFLIVGLAVCLTACGNNDIKKEDIILNENKEVNADTLTNEGNVVEDLGEVKEENNIEEDKQPEIVEKVQEPKTKDIEEKKEEVLVNVEPEVIYEEGVEIGKKAVDFEIELLSGEKVKLSDYTGKPVFLNFWATWCGPCVGEMPDIQKIKDEYGDKLTILAVNCGELKEDVKVFIDKKGYAFNIGLNEEGNLLDTYDSMYIPLSVFTDENGIIRERKVGALSEKEMFDIVNGLLSTK